MLLFYFFIFISMQRQQHPNEGIEAIFYWNFSVSIKRISMANDQSNHVNENNVDAVNIQDGLSAAELFANRDGLTYK